MNIAAGPALAAAVTNAGGLGVIGGIGYTPSFLKDQLDRLKEGLIDKNAPFGVDLLLPKVGEGARKTNSDYTKGQLPELIDIIIQSKAKLFVSAVGVPPKWCVDKLHANGIVVMNMVGAVKHVQYALAAGVDVICAQGGEGGGHTGSIPTSILIPKVVDAVKGHFSPLSGEQVPVVAAGGIFDGRGLAMALSLGAQAAWVGTRFVASIEAGAPKRHKQGILDADYDDTIRTLIYTGRPMRVLKTNFIMDWEENKQKEIKALCAKGIIPIVQYVEEKAKERGFSAAKDAVQNRPLLMGQCAGAINDILSAKDIVESMVSEAVFILRGLSQQITSISKL
eukprot:gb/GEZN01009453.1/.p1 GENE.gb/GEZN01009453.1/~~gb/GEZN01009453.1/.p1  ORF type:complete len:368 (+),score=38.55 gb/GEZN01009453.1/:94-1104(+)